LTIADPGVGSSRRSPAGLRFLCHARDEEREDDRGRLPVLLLRAEHEDDTEQLAAFRAAVPQAEVHTLHSRHDLLADAPDETIRLVGDWLDGFATTPGR
jgi:hypothetical protein